MSEDSLSKNQVEIRLLELSESLGFTKDTIHWVYGGIGLLSSRKRQQNPKAESFHVSAGEVCAALLRDIRSTFKEPIREVLSDLGIESSKDVGRIVFGLVEKNLIKANDDDSIADFDGLFDQSNLDEFLVMHGITGKSLDIRRRYRQVMWLFYSLGTGIVLGSYLGMVESRVAWAGWGLAMLGFLMQFYKPPESERF